MGKTLKQRFEKKFVKTESGCWEWQASLVLGYGYLRNGKKMGYAHRISYRLYVGEIPKGAMICHKCNNRKCVNPDHLYAGDSSTNQIDSIRDGTHNSNGYDGRYPNAKLNKELVKDIKLMLKSGFKQAQIGKIHQVTRQTIYHIDKGKTWKDVYI